MTGKNPRRLEQQVAQLGTIALIDAYFGDRIDSMLAGGLANDLVIELFEEVDTRTDGDLSARQKGRAATSSSPVRPATGCSPRTTPAAAGAPRRARTGSWGVLRDSQEDAAEEAEERWQQKTGFVLLDGDESNPIVVHAPLLGPVAVELPPVDHRGDYAEFMRAYRIAFLHWLRTEAGGAAKKSRTSFAHVLRTLAAGGEGEWTGIFAEVYGAPLSAASTEEMMTSKPAPLEARFLDWLSKQ